MKQFLILNTILFLSLKVYSQNLTDKTLLETMQQSDTLFIYFSSKGEYDFKCGATRKNTLKLYYKNGQLQAQALKGGKNIISKVDSNNLDFLIAIEEESHKYDDRNRVCKYSDGYWYYLNDEFKFRIIDQSCEWHGFTKMTEKLLGFAFP